MNRRAFLTALLAVTLTACSTTDLVKAAGSALGVSNEKPMVGIDTEVGDDHVALGDTQDHSTTIDDVEGPVHIKNQTETTEINEGPSPFMALLLSLGWLAPSPQEMWRMWKNRKKNDE